MYGKGPLARYYTIYAASARSANDPTCPRVDHVSDRLLQLSTGRPAADNDRTTEASAERVTRYGVRTGTERASVLMGGHHGER